ncbi:MAG: DUF1850 domain-containing protein [Bacillota bacterium]
MKTNIFKKITILIVLFFLLTVINSVSSSAEGDFKLQLLDESENILKEFKVKSGSEFIVNFVHSSELEPWDNLFEISPEGKMILREIRVPSTGPGVPSVLPDNWEFKIKDGYFIYDSVDKEYETIDYIVSSISPHYLLINEEKINLVEISEDWAKIKFRICK